MEGKKPRGGAHAAGKHESPRTTRVKKAPSAPRTKTEKRQHDKKQPKKKGMGALLIAGLILFLAIAFCGYTAWQLYFNDTVRQGVWMGNVELSGMTPQEARAALQNAYGKALDQQLDITAAGQSFTISVSDAGLSYDINGSAQNAYDYGRQGSVLQRAKDFWSARRQRVQLELATTLNTEALPGLVDTIAQQVQQPLSPSSYSYADGTLKLDKGQSGYTLDSDDLIAQVENALRTAQFDQPIEGQLVVTEPQTLDADAILAQIVREPVETSLDLDTDPTGNTILAGQTGVQLERDVLLQALNSEERMVSVSCQVTEPKYTASELKALLFRDVLGECTSTFNAKLKGRTTNVLLAAGFCNGTILLPGDIFSYNDTVGPRTYERGFMDAIVYIGTSAEDGVGGGICQVSSTIYAAMLRADLETVERYPHSREVTYVGKGEDATVAWGSKDFRFANNTEFPVKMEVTNTENTITVRLYGTKTQNKTVKIETNILEKTPFETVKVLDETLTPGTEKVESNGYTGYKSETYRVVYIDGVQVSRTLENTSTYKKYDKVIHYNPATTVTPTPTPTPTPEPEPTPAPDPEPTPEPDPTPDPGEDDGGDADPFPRFF